MKKPWFFIVSETDVPDHFSPTIKDIQRSVCRKYPRLLMNDMVSACRSKNIVIPRQLAMYLSRHLTAKSMPTIGRSFGNRDHTTVHHAVAKINRLLLAGDQTMNRIVSEVRIELGCPA